MSDSNMPQKGAGPNPANSITLTPESGPLATRFVPLLARAHRPDRENLAHMLAFLPSNAA